MQRTVCSVLNGTIKRSLTQDTVLVFMLASCLLRALDSCLLNAKQVSFSLFVISVWDTEFFQQALSYSLSK